MKIQYKIVAMTFVLIMITASTIVGIAFRQKTVLQEELSTEVDELAIRGAEKTAQDVYLMCQAMRESVEQVVAANLRVAADVLQRAGSIGFTPEQVTWQAVNQFSKEAKTVTLPKMLIGNRWFGQNTKMETATPVVDEVKALVGGTCTIFQRMNETGDMLRIATNVQGRDGSRAVGTFIPKQNPDGKPNSVIETVLRGETYRGRAFVVDSWYVTAYQPLWDAAHRRVEGILYVGVKQENVESLRKGIQGIVVGRTGSVFVLGGSGDQKGTYLIAPEGEKNGAGTLGIKDAEGYDYMRQIVESAVALKNEGQAIGTAHVRYRQAGKVLSLIHI